MIGTSEEKLSIKNINDGELVAIADEGIQAILDDMASPEAPSKGKWKLTVVLEFTPNENGVVKTEYSATPLLPKRTPGVTAILTGRENGKNVAREIIREQKPLFADNVMRIKNDD